MNSVKDVFVIMPFSATKSCSKDEWTEIYEQVFRPAINACDYVCDRALPTTGNLISSIIQRLQNAYIVLADVTDHNPNVFYELGVRHSLSKRTIIVSQDSSNIPSDLKGYWNIQYGTRPAQVSEFHKDIHRLIREIENDPDKSDSPVSDFLKREHLAVSNYIRIETIKKLGALKTELSGNIIALEELSRTKSPDNYQNLLSGIFKKIEKEKNNNESSILISVDCLKIILHTLYIDIGTELLSKSYEFLHDIFRIQSGHHSPELINVALNTAQYLLKRFNEIYLKIVAGTYTEPATISTMVWKSNNNEDNKSSTEDQEFYTYIDPDGGEYIFRFDQQDDGNYYITIIDQPSYGDRSTSLHATHRMWRNNRMVLCLASNTSPSKEKAKKWAQSWAHMTYLYIKEGRHF